MFSAILAKLSAAVMSIAIGVSSLLGAPPLTPQQNIGASIPNVVALFETSLASKITSAATTATLVSGTDAGGSSLSGLYGFIIDEGSSNEEFLLCTAAGTALSGCTRGVSVSNPTTTTASLAKEHRRGASVKITNYPQLGVLTRIINGQASYPNLIYYNSTKDFSLASASVIVDKYYVDTQNNIGAANASLILQGLVEMATSAEIDARTGLGATGARLFINPSYLASSSLGSLLLGLNGYVASASSSNKVITKKNTIQLPTSTAKIPMFTLTASAQGDIWYQNSAGAFVNLPASKSGSFLVSSGAGANPKWFAPPSSASADISSQTGTTSETTVTGSSVVVPIHKTGARVHISLIAECEVGTTGDFTNIYPQIDGAGISSNSFTTFTGSAGTRLNCSFSALSGPLSKGVHTFSIKIKRLSGSGTTYFNKGQVSYLEIY